MDRKTIDINKPLSEIINEYPELMDILMYEYGLNCAGCYIAEFDTLKEGAVIHGIEGKYFDEMITNLENIINESDY